MRKSWSNRWKTLLWVPAFVVLVSLACNIPFRRTDPGLSPDDLQSTLQALEQTWPTEFVLGNPEEGEADTPPISGLATATSAGTITSETPEPGKEPSPNPALPYGMLAYFTQSGDTRSALAARFDVKEMEIVSSETGAPEEAKGLLAPGKLVYIPDRIKNSLSSAAVLPDSEIVLSPSTIGFDIATVVDQFGGYLSTYEEAVHTETLSGAEIVRRVAELTSTNPRFLLAFLEFRSGWVLGDRMGQQPIGFKIPDQDELYRELSIAANQLNRGYYGWRDGSLTSLEFPNGEAARLHPALNAGTVAVQRLFSFFYDPGDWERALYGSPRGSTENGFTQIYSELFGDPWERAAVVEPLLPAGLVQPALELPFSPGNRWALTGGPHYSWNAGSPRGALDFSPVTGKSGCYLSPLWSTASANGVVVRDGDGILMLDLDGDGFEQTGWVLFYLHLAVEERIPVGTFVETDMPLGKPSCEGGITSGTHLHLARKYNGEWLAADGPLPFVLSGWQAEAGGTNYAGRLVKDGQVVTANSGGKSSSIIQR